MLPGLDSEDLEYFQTAFDNLVVQMESHNSESHALFENEQPPAVATCAPMGPELSEALSALECDDHVVTWLPDPQCSAGLRSGAGPRLLDRGREDPLGRFRSRQRSGGAAGGPHPDELCVYHRSGSARTEGTYKVPYAQYSYSLVFVLVCFGSRVEFFQVVCCY